MKKVGYLLYNYFNSQLPEDGMMYSRLFSCWKTIAGEQLAAHSRIKELEKNILIVEADHPGWIQILQTKQKILLENVRKSFPELTISGICFKLSTEPFIDLESIKNVSTTEESQPDNEQNVPADDADYGEIKDEYLRTLLKRLEKHIKAKNG